MLIKRQTEVLKQALDTYGIENQKLMVMEEMSELQKELCKHSRGADNFTSIAEEIADVIITLEQMIMYFKCERKVEYFTDFKISRLQSRLDVLQREKN